MMFSSASRPGQWTFIIHGPTLYTRTMKSLKWNGGENSGLLAKVSTQEKIRETFKCFIASSVSVNVKNYMIAFQNMENVSRRVSNYLFRRFRKLTFEAT